MEQRLEEYRQKYYPDAPSRFKCTYATLIPSSRFVGFGNLYEVEPIGRMLVTDSSLIDRMHNNFDRSRREYDSAGHLDLNDAKRYWNGVEPTRHNLRLLEVLCDSARVINAIDEPGRIISGSKIALPISIEGEFGLNIKLSDVEDARKQMVRDGLMLKGKIDPYTDGDDPEQNVWLRQKVVLPKGYETKIYVRYSEYENNDYGRDPVITLIDDAGRKMLVMQGPSKQIMNAYRVQYR